MAAEIKEVYGIESQLIAGSGGVFDVKADDKLIFSKYSASRFPTSDEILNLLEPLLKPKS